MLRLDHRRRSTQRGVATATEDDTFNVCQLLQYLRIPLLLVGNGGDPVFIFFLASSVALTVNPHKRCIMETATHTAVYAAVFVDDIEGLEQVWNELPDTPALLPEEYAHHATLMFKPDEEYISRLGPEIGKEVQLRICCWAADDKAQAVGVSLRGSWNGREHITMATKPGVPPFYSNELLKKEPVHYLNKPFEIKGRIGYFDTGGNKVFSLKDTHYEYAWAYLDDQSPPPGWPFRAFN